MAGSEAHVARAAIFAFAFLVAGCSRKAEIANEPDAGLVGPSAPRDETPVSSVDGGVDAGAFQACSERPSGERCRGVNDFPCNFQPWAVEVITGCQTESGCITNGRVVVEMGNDGCVVDLLMSEPNLAFARCAIERWGAYRCECRGQSVEVHLGYSNEGCGEPVPCQSGEFRCPTGQTCAADGYCHIELGGVGGDSG
jgi:hypothetical protein